MKGWLIAGWIGWSLGSAWAQTAVIPSVCIDEAADQGLFLDAPQGNPVSKNYTRRLSVQYSNETTIQRSRYFNWNRILKLLADSKTTVEHPQNIRAANDCLADETTCGSLRTPDHHRAYCAQAFAEHALRYAMNYYEGIVFRCHAAFVRNQPQLFNARTREELFHRPDFRLHCVDDDAEGNAMDQVEARLLRWEESVRFLDRTNRVHRKSGRVEILTQPAFSDSTSRLSVREWVKRTRAAENGNALKVRQALDLAYQDAVFAPKVREQVRSAALAARRNAYQNTLNASLRDSQNLPGTFGHAARTLTKNSGALTSR